MGVVLLLPSDVTAAVDGIRRACGDRSLGRVPAHVTLVPPVNVRAAALDAAGAVVRAAAAAAAPFELTLGPAATFHPVTPVAHLGVGGDLEALSRLRAAVHVPPLDPVERFPFVPHVTLVDGAPEARLLALVDALVAPLATFVVDAVHLLEERRDDDGVRRWRPVVSVPFASTARLERGGLRVELATEAVGDGWQVTAREPDGTVVGRAVAWPAGAGTIRLLGVDVAASRRGHGIGRVLVQAVLDRAGLEHAAVIADDHPMLRHLGFLPTAGPGTVVRAAPR